MLVLMKGIRKHFGFPHSLGFLKRPMNFTMFRRDIELGSMFPTQSRIPGLQTNGFLNRVFPLRNHEIPCTISQGTKKIGCKRQFPHPIFQGDGVAPWASSAATLRVGIPERCCGVREAGQEGRSWTRLRYARSGFPSWSGSYENNPLGTQVSPKWTPPGATSPLLTTPSRTTSFEPGRQVTSLLVPPLLPDASITESNRPY
jgi:hypothetical protein